MKIGTDIIQISRIEDALHRHGTKFKNRFLSSAEMQLAKKPESLAGFWASKEAISKALGCGIGSRLGFHDITIKKDPRGAPFFNLSEDAQKLHPILSSSLSISHDGGFAIAVVAIIMQEGKD
jgi:holo-[acyl-carrier protein] synthase